ncbi:MAG TPA: DUF2975 domain-containing protein [Segeticoccus sp.]|nr:DUF2975 domain-containing protein [Segeticoccus sp.]
MGWLVTVLVALLIALAGVSGLSGWSDYHYRISLLPGTHLLDLSYQPSWGVTTGTRVCPRIDLGDRQDDCESVVLQDSRGQVLDGQVVRQSDVRPVSAQLTGRLLFDADPGWNPLVASLYAMTVLSVLVLALVLCQLWLLLRTASRGDPFTDVAVRRLRVIGLTLIAWEVLEPLLWLFLSPKAWDYDLVGYGGQVVLQLTSMEPGAQLAVIAFGALLLLLAEVFRRGTRLESEQRLTV